MEDNSLGVGRVDGKRGEKEKRGISIEEISSLMVEATAALLAASSTEGRNNGVDDDGDCGGDVNSVAVCEKGKVVANIDEAEADVVVVVVVIAVVVVVVVAVVVVIAGIVVVDGVIVIIFEADDVMGAFLITRYRVPDVLGRGELDSSRLDKHG